MKTHKISFSKSFYYCAMSIGVFALLVTWSLIAAANCLIQQPQSAAEIRVLTSGQMVEREIAGGESHSYEISLAAGQFVRFRLEQRAIDSSLILNAPDGKVLAEMNMTITGDEESLSLEAAATGNYRLTVKSIGLPGLRGAYRLTANLQASATANDRKRLAAEALMMEASQLARQSNKTGHQVIEKCEQAQAIWQELGESSWVANSLVKIGVTYNSLNRSDKGIASLEKALAMYLQNKNRSGEGTALSNLGIYYGGISQTEKAISYFSQELAIHRELKDRRGEARVLSNLGLGYMFQSEYEKALAFLQEGLPITKELNDQFFEGRMLSTIGTVNGRMGRYETAIDYHEQALQISRAVKDQLGVGNTLMTLGNTYSFINRGDKSINYYEQALAIFREIKYRVGEGNTLSSLGNIHQNLREYEKAIEYYDQALAIFREAKFRSGEATALNNLAEVNVKLKKTEKALAYLEQSLALAREAKNRYGEQVALIRTGSALRGLGKFDQSLALLTEGLAITRAIGDRSFEIKALIDLAVTEDRRGNLAQARANIEEALQRIESIRTTAVLSPESRRALFSDSQEAHHLYTDLLMRMHQSDSTKGFDVLAVETSERQRARSLLDQLLEASLNISESVDPALVERERMLGRQLNDKAQRLLQATKPEQAALKQEISQLETDYERAQAAIRKASPRYAALTQPQPLKLAEIQALLDADSLMLEYTLGEDSGYLFAITKDSLKSYKLPKGAEIEKDARLLHELLSVRSITKRGESAQQRQQRIQQAEAKLPAVAEQLSQMLIAPVAAELGDKRLVIVADGALQYIPFAMLPDPAAGKFSTGNQSPSAGRQTATNRPLTNEYRPLIVGHEIVNLPSASALAIQRTELAGRTPSPKMLAVIADPVFDRSDARVTTSTTKAVDQAQSPSVTTDSERRIEHLAEKSDDPAGTATRRFLIPRLPFTRQEATRLLALAPKSSSFAATDFQANREAVLGGNLSQYRYVHFATHGVLNSEQPGLSSLVLSMVDASGKPQTGILTANDIYNLKLPAELVVLSACQTGLGKEIRGEGLVGLTRGFMYAGAARVVVSLWSVSDKATSELMAKFYEKMLKENRRPAAALRAAQVEMWKLKQWQSPYYWAAFTLQGEWR